MPPAPNAIDQLPLHPLTLQVLLVLAEGARHGYGIAKGIEEKDGTRGTVYPTNLYRRLRDMARSGLIEESPSSDEHEQRRSTFSITPLGRRVAAEEARRLESVVSDARRLALLAPPPADG